MTSDSKPGRAVRQRATRWLVMLVPMLLWAQVAFAHPQAGEAKGFLTGFKHPISGLDHVLAMVAVGLWGAQLGSPAIWLLPVAFPMVMAFGGMLGLMGVPLPGVEYGIAASAILLGAAVMFEVRPPLAVAASWSVSSPSSTDTHTARNCRPERAACCTALGSSSRPAACTEWASASASSIAGCGDRECCGSPVPSSRWAAAFSCGRRSHESCQQVPAADLRDCCLHGRDVSRASRSSLKLDREWGPSTTG